MELQAKRALARIFEAYGDLEAAKLLCKSVRSRSLFHSQQCIEKCLKACLSKVIIGEIRLHQVVKVLKEKLFSNLSDSLQKSFNEIEEEAFWVERRWMDTRYEEISSSGKIIVPTLKFKQTDAVKGVQVAERTLDWAIDCVNEVFSLSLPNNYLKLRKIIEKELQ